MINNWLGREGLQLIATLTTEEQDACNDEKGLYETLRKQFKLQCNEMIRLLQFHKMVCCSNESLKELMGRLRTPAVECKYKEVDRQLKEQFIHGLNDKEMLAEVIRELKIAGKMLLSPIKLF